MNDKPRTFWFYKRVKIEHPTETVLFHLAAGLGFVFRRFQLIQPDYLITPGPVTNLFPGLGVELVSGTGIVRWQLQAIPADTYSAPRRDRITVKTETAPVDLLAYGVNMTAPFKPRANTVNLFYDINEIINIKISGQEYFSGPGIWGPNYVDFAAEGFYLP